MIIILEGPDGSGKTTLANKIKDQTGFMLLHRSHQTDSNAESLFDEYAQVIKAGKNCIMDRGWYSEMVYGPVMRGGSAITYPQMYELERMLAKNGALIIHCTAPEATLWKRCLKRGEDYVTKKDTFHAICNGFDTLMMDVPHYVPVLTYEYKDL
jgi:thymidylate kinase